MKTEIKKLAKSEVEIDFELTPEEFQLYIDKALNHLKNHVKVDGFRKGHVPANIAEEKIGKENLLMEAGDLAVNTVYPKLMEDQKLEPIGQPEVQIKKIVPISRTNSRNTGSRIPDGETAGIGTKEPAFIFTVKVTVLPEVQLPDYKEIASKIKSNDTTVEEKEIQDTLNYLQKSRAKFTTENRPAQDKDFVEIEYSNKDINDGKAIKDRFILGEGGFLKDFEDNVLGMKAGEEKEFTAKFPSPSQVLPKGKISEGKNTPRKDLAGKDATFKVKMLSVQKMELSEVNDEFAKSLGAFESLTALKDNLKEGIALEKKESEKQRVRAEMLDKISQKTAFDLPDKMVEFEKERLFEDLKLQVSNKFNIPFEQYLNSVKKTEQEIKDTYKLEAEKRIKTFLVLRQIGRQEKIEATPEEITEEVQNLMKNHNQAEKNQIDINRLTEYSKGTIFNEKVLEKLESFSK